jgi:threonylcarbamoyladenosine tRNA methylthiotransferase MtaB
MIYTKKTVAFYTFGCKLNFAESSALARLFVENGFERVSPNVPADIYVINTCSVTDRSDSKCRQTIRKLVKRSPSSIIAVTGCYAQLKPQEIAAIEGVDLVLGTDAKGRLLEYVNQICDKGNARVFSCEINKVNSFFRAYSSGDRTRTFLKVQDGCNYHCAFCTVPLARGKSRNVSIASLLDEARAAASTGVKEIILTGVNIGDFGRSTGESFASLLKELDEVEGIERYRISSIEPNLLTDEIIDFTSSSNKFLPHFHIPLQSGSERILKTMRRRYLPETLADRMQAIRNKRPNTFFGIDLIVGFPGETDEDFAATYEFVKSLNPAFLHVFPYSERPNTPAASMPNKVPTSAIAERAKSLGELSAELHRSFYEKHIGTQAKILFESTRRGEMMFGFTENYIKVEIPHDKSLAGRIVEGRLSGISKTENMMVDFLDC